MRLDLCVEVFASTDCNAGATERAVMKLNHLVTLEKEESAIMLRGKQRNSQRDMAK